MNSETLDTFRAQRFYHICLGLALNEVYRNGRLFFHYRIQQSTYFRSITGPRLHSHPLNWTESYGSLDGIHPAISKLSFTAFASYLKDFHVIFKWLPLRGELSYLAPLGSENISAPYFKQCFFRGGGITPPRLSQTPRLPVPRQK